MSGQKTRVYITVDTETSMDGAWGNPARAPLTLDRLVYGKLGSRFYGIPLIMDILEEHGLRATFFTEMFCSYAVGAEEVAGVCREILKRGHDCQLHLHPIYRFYWKRQQGEPSREMDFLFQLSPLEQREFIGEGVRLFRELSGKAPRVYRAGCYAGSEAIMATLREHGIEIDSSYNLAYLGQTCGFETKGLNAPAVIDSVHEFPITVFRVNWTAGYKPLEISAVSVREILDTIHALRTGGCQAVVLVLHSFSLLKNQQFEQWAPDHIVIQRLRKLCTALADRKGEIETGVMGEIDLNSFRMPQPQVVPSIGWVQPTVRKLVQAANRLPWL